MSSLRCTTHWHLHLNTFSRWAICIFHFSSLSSTLSKKIKARGNCHSIAIPFVFSEVWSMFPKQTHIGSHSRIYNVSQVEAMLCGSRMGRSIFECVKRFKKVWTSDRIVNSCWLQAGGHGVSDTATHVQYVVMHVYDGDQRSGMRVMAGMRRQHFLKGADGFWDTGCCFFSSTPVSAFRRGLAASGWQLRNYETNWGAL